MTSTNSPNEVHKVGPWVMSRTDQLVQIAMDGEVLAHISRLGPLAAFFCAEEGDLCGSARHALVNDPVHFILFGDGPLGLQNMTAGMYEATWFDTTPGLVHSLEEAFVDGGDMLFAPPRHEPGDWHVLHLRRIGR